ncbi:lipid-transfer protein [Georgenia ruanii]|uniref:Lipid-transfer protein n=1 Tax=Georgenia ruanii TaxID=348442 RepID=A0A7J9V0R2_9MICO|nr:lipid-transfer protein [Georgenia ruanii]
MFPARGLGAIAGIGATDFSKASGRSELTLATQAAVAAAEDAGVDVKDIDGIVRCDMDLVHPNDLSHVLGLRDLTYWGDVGPGGVAPSAMVGQAVAAILTGQATTVLVFRSLNGRSGQRFGQASSTSGAVGGNGTYDEFFMPFGLTSPGQVFAMFARRHMIEFGTREEDFGAIAINSRERALVNPQAQMHGRPLTMEDYLASRQIATPLRLFDFCLETDGACAVIVTSTERARDLRQPPAVVRAWAQGTGFGVQPGIGFPALMREDLTSLPSKAVAETLYRRAGLGPSDIDVAQLYDCYTVTVLMQLEDYGFCEKGEGGSFVSSGAIDIDGQIPTNTSGGQLSEGYIHGMTHVLEGVRQIRGTSTSQVTDAELCLVTSTPYSPGSALILEAAS